MPLEPTPTQWVFGDPAGADPDDDLIAIGADLEPGTLLAAYRRGLFPMPSGDVSGDASGDAGGDASGDAGDPTYWFSPVRRGVLRLDQLVVSRSLRRSVGDFEIRVDTALPEVIEACSDPSRPSGWIDAGIKAAYLRLHDLGWVHSVETWRDDRLVGGLYGVAIGGLFAGESMFHRARDASKVALVGLVDLLRDEHAGDRLIDTQWSTPHLASLGVEEISREAYLRQLPDLLTVAPPSGFPRKHPA